MVSVWEAVEAMGYESSREADVVLAAPHGGGMIHATLSEVGARKIEDIGTLYVASGRFKTGTITRHRGRSAANLYDIIDLPFDFDLTAYTGRTDEQIWDQPYEETEAEINALAEDVLEAMSAIRLPPFQICNTGYGVLARVRVASPFRTRVEDLRKLQSHYVESINRFYGSGFCDKQVSDAGTRLTRVVGSYNEKTDVPREVRIIHQGEELFDPSGVPIVRRPVRHEPIPEERPLAPDVRRELVNLLAEAWEDGYRHQLALGAAGMMARAGVPERTALEIIREAGGEDREHRDRERAVHTTYDNLRSGRPISGYMSLAGLSAGREGQSFRDRFGEWLSPRYREESVGGREFHHRPSADGKSTLRSAPLPRSQEVSVELGVAHERLPETINRGWYRDYLDLVSPTTSSPDIYHLASILTVTGIMVGRRIGAYLGENQWPILHTVLVGETGLTKKDTAMNRAIGTMLTSVNGSFNNFFTTLAGVGSAEALADQLGQSNVLLRLSEFSGFLHKARQPATANLRPMITELWNCGPEYSLLTRGNPTRITNPTMALLAAIPPETLTREMGSEDVQSGFANRLLFVFGTGKEAIARPPSPNWASLGDLASEMRELILGYAPGTVLPFSREAGRAYDEWFYDFVKITYLTELERQMAQRVPAYVVRIALLYAIAEGADEIGLDHVAAGRDFTTLVFTTSAPHTRSWGASPEARLASAILSFVGEAGRPRADIDRAFSELYGPIIVGRTLTSLRDNGRIEFDSIGFVRQTLP